ncbi:LysR family transcriptional regulator [Ferrimonas futtsuensis]|uniref:LysR family transcriptional regulator n=1 Tax=Ferrimonas futtsuensis TaxID=364764 RepID=UPI0003F8F5A3|nr:LysR family transcriptional regulator [Ferrimonas futtsuensis]
MKLDQLNYNQLKVLLAVYKHGQGHQAANELGMTASAVSRTLKGLRDIFKDSLFVRRSCGLIPTEKTNQLIPLAKKLVDQYQQIEQHYSVFTPEESGGQFTILAYDEFVYAVQKVVNDHILTEAPNLKFEIRTLSHDCTVEVANGDIDFMVVYEGFEGKNLNWDMFAETGDLYILANHRHPILAKEPNLADIARYPLLELDNYNDLTCPLLVNLCREVGHEMEVAGYTDSVATAMRMLADSNSITLSCNQFTRQFVDMVPHVDYVKLPDELARRVRERRRTERDIGNYILYGDINNSASFNWVKSKLIYGLEKEWRKASER